MNRSLLLALIFTISIAMSVVAAAVEMPKAVDDRLLVELFAAEPDIVTPTGIAVDSSGRVLVIESHTHFRPANYQGPPADRIRCFEDTDGDGHADRITTFFEGTRSTMNLALDPAGHLYVATRNEIFRLRDTDGDGQADERTPIVRMESDGNYPHNGLSGFAFDHEHNVYFGMGENLGVPYKLVGSDGSTQSGSEGGHIFRCTDKGGDVQRWATGFWNPFHLALDPYERLFAVDNDPDALPPCRLLHVVHGGNYGFKYRDGRRGLHPFTAWNGELPGTLPMVAGTGEAPSGIVSYQSDNLPWEYVGQLLVTSWGDHRLERFALEPQGASFRSVGKPFVTGGENFRPVGIAVAPDGSLFVSDWVDKSYEVHGKGRIWHVRAKQPAQPANVAGGNRSSRMDNMTFAATIGRLGAGAVENLLRDKQQDPRLRAAAIVALASVGKDNAIDEALQAGDFPPDLAQLAASVADADSDTLARFVHSKQPADVRAAAFRRFAAIDPRRTAFTQLWLSKAWEACEDQDPFIQQAARLALGSMNVVDANLDTSRLDAAQRLAAILILRETDQAPGDLLFKSLSDPDPQVRFVAVQWIGEERLAGYRPDLEQVLTAGPISERLFAAYLAAQEKLDGAARTGNDEWAGEQYVARALGDPKSPPAVRRWALRVLRPDHPLLTIEFLRTLIAGNDADLQREAICTLRASPHPERAELLRGLAGNKDLSAALRAEAVVGIDEGSAENRALLLGLASSEVEVLRHEALRSLVGAALDPEQQTKLRAAAERYPDSSLLVARVLEPQPAGDRPAADRVDAWLKLLAGPADAAEGERIFFHPHAAGCFRCHALDGRGGRIGPDLTTTGRTLDRRRLVESILQPSKEVAPQFVTWLIETEDGRVLSGQLVREAVDGTQTFADEKGQEFSLHPRDIAERKPQSRSIMPDGLERLLTTQEFRDLLAYLQSEPEAVTPRK